MVFFTWKVSVKDLEKCLIDIRSQEPDFDGNSQHQIRVMT